MVEQLNVYDFVGKEEDPLFLAIKNIKENESITIGDYTITLNSYGIYEVSDDEIHESKSSLESCYDYLVKRVIFLE